MFYFSDRSTFRSTRPGFEKPTQFDNGPEIDTWTNETAVIGEKEPKSKLYNISILV